MLSRRTRWGLAVAAGLAWLSPAGTARAQFSYGYDSFVYTPTAQTYFYNAGYSPVYNDATTGEFANGTAGGPRTLAPYADPPYGQFNRGGLPNYNGAAVTRLPSRPLVNPRRKGLLGRTKGRR